MDISANIKTMTVDQIIVDPDRFQVREDMNEDAVASYAEAMQDGGDFPKIKVLKLAGKHYLIDGFHRLAACKACGHEKVPVMVIEGTELDGVRRAIEGNRIHGVRLSRADKRRALHMYVNACRRADEEIPTVRELAALVGVGKSTAARWVDELEDADAVSPPEPAAPHEADDELPPTPSLAVPTRPVKAPATTNPVVMPQQPLAVRIAATRQQHETLARGIRDLHTELEAQGNEPLSIFLRERRLRIRDHITQLTDMTLSTAPEEPCPACRGTGCRTCGDRGWLSRDQALAYHKEHGEV